MRIMERLIKGRGWLMYSSSSGGVLGALLMIVNEVANAHAQLAFGIKMGLPLTTALGMIGGILGGAVGCFIGGRLAKEEIVINVGESLGVGLLNGFLCGTAAGFLMGFVYRWRPELLSTGPLLALMAVVIVVSILAFAGRRPSGLS
jgi:hypothetical protein